MTEELVNRKYLIDKIAKAQTSLETDDDAMREINKKYHKGLSWAHGLVVGAPAVEAREIVHGKWIQDTPFSCVCSVCNHYRCGIADEDHQNYCSNCGANMDGRDNVPRKEG